LTKLLIFLHHTFKKLSRSLSLSLQADMPTIGFDETSIEMGVPRWQDRKKNA